MASRHRITFKTEEGKNTFIKNNHEKALEQMMDIVKEICEKDKKLMEMLADA